MHACRCVLDVAPLRMLPAFFAVLEALPPIPPEDSPMQVLAGGGEGGQGGYGIRLRYYGGRAGRCKLHQIPQRLRS